MKQDDPANAFFNFGGQIAKKGVPSNFGTMIKAAGVTGEVKYVAMPLNKNSLLFRFENLADVYDGHAKIATVKIEDVFNAFYMEANSGALPENIDWTEMSLTANMPLKEMQSRKIQWKTVDDDKLEKKPMDMNDGATINLEPQRIRVFKVDFTPKSSDSKFLTA